MASVRATETKRLSFCMTCKGRLWQLEKTLAQNLRDNRADRRQIEFVLVDFDTPGLRAFVEAKCADALSDGYLRYYHTRALPYWLAAKAKNTAHVLASGQILVNLDCDNFTGKQAGRFILSVFDKYGMDSVFHIRYPEKCDSSYGRIAMSRASFLALGGYNEKLLPLGFEDSDLMLRFCALWPQRKLIRFANETVQSSWPRPLSAQLVETRVQKRNVWIMYPLSGKPTFIPQSKAQKIENIDPTLQKRADVRGWMQSQNESTSKEDVRQGRLVANIGSEFLGVDPRFVSEPLRAGGNQAEDMPTELRHDSPKKSGSHSSCSKSASSSSSSSSSSSAETASESKSMSESNDAGPASKPQQPSNKDKASKPTTKQNGKQHKKNEPRTVQCKPIAIRMASPVAKPKSHKKVECDSLY